MKHIYMMYVSESVRILSRIEKNQPTKLTEINKNLCLLCLGKGAQIGRKRIGWFSDNAKMIQRNMKLWRFTTVNALGVTQYAVIMAMPGRPSPPPKKTSRIPLILRLFRWLVLIVKIHKRLLPIGYCRQLGSLVPTSGESGIYSNMATNHTWSYLISLSAYRIATIQWQHCPRHGKNPGDLQRSTNKKKIDLP